MTITRLLILFIMMMEFAPAGGLTVNLQNHFGMTVVDVAQARDVPLYSDVSGQYVRHLTDCDNFSYKGLIQVFFIDRGESRIGAELGFNALYWWEEKYYVGTAYNVFTGRSERVPRWQQGEIWTWHLGALIQRNISDKFYIQSGLGIHTFFNGTGTTAGISAAVGYNLRFLSVITIPLEARTDIVFGRATPISFLLGFGFKFDLGS